MHPYITAELVRQLRAALEGESHNQRLAHRLPPRARTDPARDRVTATARTWPATSAPWSPAPPEPTAYGGRHDNPPRAQRT
jgi:hypothetical protein